MNDPVETQQPECDPLVVDKPQMTAETQTASVSTSQPVGQRINAGLPSVATAIVGEKTIEERKVEMAEEVEKTRKRLEQVEPMALEIYLCLLVYSSIFLFV